MKICLHAQFDARKTTGYFSFSNVPPFLFLEWGAMLYCSISLKFSMQLTLLSLSTQQ